MPSVIETLPHKKKGQTLPMTTILPVLQKEHEGACGAGCGCDAEGDAGGCCGG